VAHSATVSTEIFNAAFHKMNMDHEKPVEVVGEHGELLDVSNSQCGDSLHTNRDWQEAMEQMKQIREFNTLYLYYLTLRLLMSYIYIYIYIYIYTIYIWSS